MTYLNLVLINLLAGAVAVRYHDQVALPEELLKDSELEIIVRAKSKTGSVR